MQVMPQGTDASEGDGMARMHCEANLRLLPHKENQMKHNKFVEAWPHE
jgi:hypothetical protein